MLAPVDDLAVGELERRAEATSARARRPRSRPARRRGPRSRIANSSPPKRATVSLAAQRVAQALGDRDEQLVAGRVAEAVVDDLEAVEVEEQHGDVAAAAALQALERAGSGGRGTAARFGRPVSGSRSSWVSFVRQATMCAALAASTKPPWMTAQFHGCATASGWL